MSVENVSSGLVPQGQKASDYDNSDPVPPRQNVVPIAEKIDSLQQGLEFLFSPLIEYYNPAHGHDEDNKYDQAPNASFQEDEFINPFCTRVQEIGESSSRNIDNTDVYSFQPQSHDYRWTRDHPLEQVHGNPTMTVQTRRQLATNLEMCMFALTMSIVEPKNIKEAMADSAWIQAMQDKLHQFDRLKVWELVDKPLDKMIIKLKWLWKKKKDEDQTQAQEPGTDELSPSLRSKAFSKTFCARSNAIVHVIQSTTQKHLKEHFQSLSCRCLDTRKKHLEDTVAGDKLVSCMSMKQNCTAMSAAEAGICGVICKLCSSNVDEVLSMFLQDISMFLAQRKRIVYVSVRLPS
ncbi:hypothetical protein Tco_0740161 [Tanacetum coccineum]